MKPKPHRRTLADVGEDALIQRLTRNLQTSSAVIAGVGDDCAVVRSAGRQSHLLLKTDAVVEGIHFSSGTPAHLAGRKALARVLSDIAAMGGRPEFALITLIAPPDTLVARVAGIYRGLTKCAVDHGVSIVGGETSRGPRLALSITLTGTVEARRWAGRGGGRAGDALMVTGRLGGSLRGRHLRFEPRLAEGQWLMRHHPVHAMMDLSDGLGKDLPRLAAASGCGFAVDPARLPVARGCSARQAWSDGEDYELLFALPQAATARLQRQWQQRFPKVPLTQIGSLALPGKTVAPAFDSTGWDHFTPGTAAP